MALERLEEISQGMMETLRKQKLTFDEMFYVVHYLERMLSMDMIEEMLEDYGLISFEDENEE